MFSQIVVFILGLAFLYPALLMMLQPGRVGQDYSPFDFLVGVLLATPSSMLLWLALAEVQ